ncbi:Hypothetical protein HDN1F_13680 [gamma proteobacterium HdN1]|nr:Hypothetical protein HDN1F_13680 [gamma proteobacterium HdN1]
MHKNTGYGQALAFAPLFSDQRALRKIALLSGAFALLALLFQMLVSPWSIVRNAPLIHSNAQALTPWFALEFLPSMAHAKQLQSDLSIIQSFRNALASNVLFLIGYSLFLWSSTCLLMGKGILRAIALFFIVVAAIANVTENFFLLRLLNYFVEHPITAPRDPINFEHLRLAVVTKFGAIAIWHVRIMRPLLALGGRWKQIALLMLANIFITGGGFYGIPYGMDFAFYSALLCWLLLGHAIMTRSNELTQSTPKKSR